jgi:hypothetical protein|tara:strand:- start:2044 stop:2298 length:255 start_codon:yes stop_codon:yes gene_type:complete
MPIRWYGPADPENPTYRHFERVVNLCLHAGLFAALNSGLWFVQEMRHPWQKLPLFSGLWLTVLIAHLLVVATLRPDPSAADPDR